MCANDSNVSRLRIRIIYWCILLNSELEDVFLCESCSMRIFTDMLALEDMFLNVENSRGHDEAQELVLITTNEGSLTELNR